MLFMTPNEAEDIMHPFFPNDSNLAGKALSTALNAGNIPEWIVDHIVGAYFTFLTFEALREAAHKHDPFGWDTIPYLKDMREGNKN